MLLKAFTFALASVLGTVAASATEPQTLPLWPEGAPSKAKPTSEATAKLIQSYGGATSTRLTNITEPTITIYKPENPNGTAVIVAPGGGFMFLSYSFEGTQVCEWLSSIGVTGVLLKYRTPTRDELDPFVIPVEDAQRAMGLVRKHAKEWGVHENKIGLLGFSAGANLAGHAAWDRITRTYPQKAEYDDLRGPDFLVFIYGGGFLDKTNKAGISFRPDFKLPADAPPAFFLVAHDDKNNPIEAAMLYLEYKKQELPAELHIMTKGGHGFGMRDAGHPINQWPKRLQEWMTSMGYLN